MGQKGTPGYDFGANELLTAKKLRRWLEEANWENLSYSVAPPGMIACFNQTAAAPESFGNIWFNLHNGLTKVYTQHGWVPVFDPFTWWTNRLNQGGSRDYLGPNIMEITANGVDISDGSATNASSFTIGNMVINEGYRIQLFVRGEPLVMCLRQESAGTLSHPLCVGAGIAQLLRHASTSQANKQQPVAAANVNAGQGCGVTTATDRPTWAVGVWMDATLHSGASNMGLVWTLDGPLPSAFRAVTGY
jgi:hypothetical protein